eukprot:scaffold655_cov105-Isochrysis_galbana.AAC.4
MMAARSSGCSDSNSGLLRMAPSKSSCTCADLGTARMSRTASSASASAEIAMRRIVPVLRRPIPTPVLLRDSSSATAKATNLGCMREEGVGAAVVTGAHSPGA